MSDEGELPAAAGAVARAYPDLYRAYAALGAACAEAGPVDRQAQRLVKLALAIGAGLGRAASTRSAAAPWPRASPRRR